MVRNIILFIIFMFGAVMYLINLRISRLQYIACKAVSKKKQYEKRLLIAAEKKISVAILPYIHINEEKRELQACMMAAAAMNNTPEQYLSQTISEIILLFFSGIIVYLITGNTVILGVMLIACYGLYYAKNRKLSKDFLKIQKQASADLPKLCGVISGKLNYTSNVENTLKSYYPIANEVMKKQLDITLADMRTGNVPQALNRLENRVRLPRLSDICRGLNAVHNGSDQRVYFEIKANEITREYETQIEQQIVKTPGKLKTAQITMVVFFLACVFYPLFQYLQTQLTILN